MSNESSHFKVELQKLRERQAAVSCQIDAEIAIVQKTIHTLTAAMTEDIREYSSLQVCVCEDIFQEVDKLKLNIKELSTGVGHMKQLIVHFSEHLSSMLVKAGHGAADHSSGMPGSNPTNTCPLSANKASFDSSVFSMEHDFEEEGVYIYVEYISGTPSLFFTTQ